MFTVAGGIILAAIILGAFTLIISFISHWFGSSEARTKQKAWEAEMERKHYPR